MTQEKQIVFSGVLTGFTLLFHGAKDRRWERDSVQQLETTGAHFERIIRNGGLSDLIELKSLIRFKTDHAAEEEVAIEGYNLVGLTKDIVANKVICQCGKPLWRIGTVEEFKDEPPFICGECLEERQSTNTNMLGLNEILAD